MFKFLLIVLLILLLGCSKEQETITFIKSDFDGIDTVQIIVDKSKTTTLLNLLEEKEPVPELYSMFNTYELHILKGNKQIQWRYHNRGYIQEIGTANNIVYKLQNVTKINSILFSPYIKKVDSTLVEVASLKNEKGLTDEELEMIDSLHVYYGNMSQEDKIDWAIIINSIPNFVDSTDSVEVKEYDEYMNQSPLYKYASYFFLFSMANICPDSLTYQYFDSIGIKELSSLIEDSKDYSGQRNKENVRLLTLRASQIPQHYRKNGVIAIRAHKNFVTYLFHGYRESRTQIIVSFDEGYEGKKVTVYYNNDIHQEIYPELRPLECKSEFRRILDNIKGNQLLPKEGITCSK